MAAMAVCSLSPFNGGISFVFTGRKSVQRSPRKLHFHGRTLQLVRASKPDENVEPGKSNPLDLEAEFRKALESDESKVLNAHLGFSTFRIMPFV